MVFDELRREAAALTDRLAQLEPPQPSARCRRIRCARSATKSRRVRAWQSERPQMKTGPIPPVLNTIDRWR